MKKISEKIGYSRTYLSTAFYYKRLSDTAIAKLEQMFGIKVLTDNDDEEINIEIPEEVEIPQKKEFSDEIKITISISNSEIEDLITRAVVKAFKQI